MFYVTLLILHLADVQFGVDQMSSEWCRIVYEIAKSHAFWMTIFSNFLVRIQLNVQSIVITCGTDSSMNCANFTDAFLVVNTDRAVKLTQIQISKAGWARPTTSKRDKILRASCARLPPGDLRQSNDFTLGLFILLSFINIFAASLNLLSTITNCYLNKSTWHIQLWDYLIPDYRHILLLLQLSGGDASPKSPPWLRAWAGIKYQ